MKLKRIVIFTMVACLLFTTPIYAKSAKRIKKSGLYSINLYTKKGVRIHLNNEYGGFADEEEIPKLWKLFKKDKQKFYKKMFNNYSGTLIDIKLKKRTLVGWGKIKKHKFNKFKFKIAKNVKGYLGYRNSEYPIGHKKLFRKIRYSKGTNFYFYVRSGKVRKIVVY